MTDLEQSALAVYFANCQGIKSDPLPMIRKILALGEGDRRVEIRLNDDGSLDEVVGLEYVHLEQMDGNHWWLGIGKGADMVHIGLHARGKITAIVNDERAIAALRGEGDA